MVSITNPKLFSFIVLGKAHFYWVYGIQIWEIHIQLDLEKSVVCLLPALEALWLWSPAEAAVEAAGAHAVLSETSPGVAQWWHPAVPGSELLAPPPTTHDRCHVNRLLSMIVMCWVGWLFVKILNIKNVKTNTWQLFQCSDCCRDMFSLTSMYTW